MLATRIARFFGHDKQHDTALVNVLFVCMGNICRSPTAEGVFRKLVDEAGLGKDIFVDSAGTHAYHIGEAPDVRAVETSKQHGVDIAGLQARMLNEDDFNRFDFIVAMDADNMRHIQRRNPGGNNAVICRLLEDAADVQENNVPDPYYGGSSGFERVYDLVEEGCQELLESVQRLLTTRQAERAQSSASA